MESNGFLATGSYFLAHLMTFCMVYLSKFLGDRFFYSPCTLPYSMQGLNEIRLRNNFKYKVGDWLDFTLGIL